MPITGRRRRAAPPHAPSLLDSLPEELTELILAGLDVGTRAKLALTNAIWADRVLHCSQELLTRNGAHERMLVACTLRMHPLAFGHALIQWLAQQKPDAMQTGGEAEIGAAAGKLLQPFERWRMHTNMEQQDHGGEAARPMHSWLRLEPHQQLEEVVISPMPSPMLSRRSPQQQLSRRQQSSVAVKVRAKTYQ